MANYNTNPRKFKRALFKPELSAIQLEVLSVIFFSANKHCKLMDKAIADRAGCSVSTVQRSLLLFEQRGYIQRHDPIPTRHRGHWANRRWIELLDERLLPDKIESQCLIEKIRANVRRGGIRE